MPGRYPTFWVLTTRALAMPEALAALWWRALTRATWSESVALRQIMLVSRNMNGLYDPDGPVTPRPLIACLEALVGERRLSRQDANRCMEYVLAQTGRDGQWAATTRPPPSPQRTRLGAVCFSVRGHDSDAAPGFVGVASARLR